MRRTFRSNRFGKIAFFYVLDPKVALPDWNSRQYVKTVGFLSKLYKTCFLGNAEDGFRPNQRALPSTFRSQKSLYVTQIHANKWKQYAFYENCTKRAFHAVRRTFWPNCICQRFRSKNRFTGLIWPNSRQYVRTVGFLWKLYKTCFSGNGEDILAKSHFSTFRSQKSLYWTEIHANTSKQ